MGTHPVRNQTQRGLWLCVALLSGACSQPAAGTSEQPSGSAGTIGPSTPSVSGGTPATPSGGAGARAPAAPSGGAGSAAVSGKAGSAAPSGGAGSPAQAGAAGMVGAGAAGMVSAAAGMSAVAGTPAAAAGSGGSSGAPATGSATELWVGPDGKDTNPGTQASPLQTLGAAVMNAKPGMTIWVLPGTYASSQSVPLKQSGEANNEINIFAAPGGERPVFDFSAQPRGQSSARGLSISGNYWHVRGIDVIKAGDNCIHISGAHNTIENVVVHGCDDTGIQITADSSDAGDKTRAANNLILNCDSYENYDSQNMGENADGFAAKLYIGPGNVFRGCRAWNNSDDGWDLFASDDVVVIDHCWAIANGKIGPSQNNTNGDGNGFKLGGAAKAGDANMGGAVHQVTNCISIGNHACGFTLNNNTKTPKLTMCGGTGDGKGMLCSLTNSGTVSVTTSASAAIAAKRKPDGSLPDLP